MESLKDILAKIQDNDVGKYVKHEWQLYGYRLARGLEDPDRISFYMRLAKIENREMLQRAWDFVKESNAKSKSRLFLWKLTLLKKEKALKSEALKTETPKAETPKS